jgi:hypothetical protein
METERSRVDYAAAAAQAEAAVAVVKDPELRRVAFEKILTTLLEDTSAISATSERKETRATAKGETARTPRPQKKGPKGHIEELIQDDFFKKQRTIADVKAELANRGHHVALSSLSGPLQALTQERKLRRQKVAADTKGTKTTYAYSNW